MRERQREREKQSEMRDESRRTTLPEDPLIFLE
jgi:hypothetical protein